MATDVTPDDELIRSAQGGERGAFAALVERHQGVVFGYLLARLGDRANAEDLCQEVFVRCYSARGEFDSPERVRPWLIGIARNVLREHVRRTKRRKEVAWTELCLELESLSGDAQGRYAEAAENLPGCLEALGPSAREALELHYRSSLKLAEIGLRLRRSEGAVKLLMFRARQALRMCLGGKTRSGEDAV